MNFTNVQERSSAKFTIIQRIFRSCCLYYKFKNMIGLACDLKSCFMPKYLINVMSIRHKIRLHSFSQVANIRDILKWNQNVFPVQRS